MPDRWHGPAALLIVLLALDALLGGSSRGDVLSQPVVELAAVVAGAWSLIHVSREEIAPYRALLAMLGLLMAYMAAQLVPLPPGIWTVLPGRQPFVEIAALAGFEQPWRPLTLTSEATREALFSTLVPLAVLLAFVRVRREYWSWTVNALLVLAGVSAVLGLLQVTGRAPGLYFYRWSNTGAVGFFANRNHQAALLALALPLLAAYALRDNGERALARRRRIVAGLGAIFLIPLILVTGSRAGLVLMLIGIVGSGLLYLAQQREAGASRRERTRVSAMALAAIAGVIGLIVVLTVFLSRAEAVQRLFSQDIGDEKRVRLLGTVLEIGRTYLPFGSGFGSFDPVFRLHEPFSNLNPRYFNHAHDDALELLIEGGIPVMLLLAAYIAWVGRRGVQVWRKGERSLRFERTTARTGSIVIVMLLTASLGDYPLRTSLLAAILMLASAMLVGGTHERAEIALDGQGLAD